LRSVSARSIRSINLRVRNICFLLGGANAALRRSQ
jgi:hypothetical protein